MNSRNSVLKKDQEVSNISDPNKSLVFFYGFQEFQEKASPFGYFFLQRWRFFLEFLEFQECAAVFVFLRLTFRFFCFFFASEKILFLSSLNLKMFLVRLGANARRRRSPDLEKFEKK